MSYSCDICNYSTIIKTHYDTHMKTIKHLKATNQISLSFKCENCSSTFGSRTSLWRHNKTTHKDILTESVLHLIQQNTELIKDLSIKDKQNTELVKDLIEKDKQIIELSKLNHTAINSNNNSHNTINNNCNNNINNVNIITTLNEKCKDAINLSDFIESINISVNDLDNMGKNGYVKELSNIIIRHIKQLDATKRPIHCADLKKLLFYVKEEDIWNKETKEYAKLNKSISNISNKSINTYSNEWKKTYPDYKNSDSIHSDKNTQVSNEIFYGSLKDNQPQNLKKILKNVGEDIPINEIY